MITSAHAIKNLNQYFAETPASEYELAAKAREFLLDQLPKEPGRRSSNRQPG